MELKQVPASDGDWSPVAFGDIEVPVWNDGSYLQKCNGWPADCGLTHLWHRLATRSTRRSNRTGIQVKSNNVDAKNEQAKYKEMKEKKTKEKEEHFVENPWHPRKQKKSCMAWILSRCGPKVPKPEVSFGPHKDGGYYGSLADAEEERIKTRIDLAMHRLKESNIDGDEEGKTRVAIGKANLLISKKFSQFRELCQTNLDQRAGAPIPPTDSGPTLDEDLGGFWELIMIQVELVIQMFNDAVEVKEPQVTMVTRQVRKPKPTPKVIAKPKIDTERDLARKKLLAEKREAMKKMRENVQEAKAKEEDQEKCASEAVVDENANPICVEAEQLDTTEAIKEKEEDQKCASEVALDENANQICVEAEQLEPTEAIKKKEEDQEKCASEAALDENENQICVAEELDPTEATKEKLMEEINALNATRDAQRAEIKKLLNILADVEKDVYELIDDFFDE